MRIRIQTQAPLPELKAWFVPDTLESVFNLKQALCQRVPALRAAQCHPKNLVLMLDGFELLDDSPFDAVRDGDLILIKGIAPAEVVQSAQFYHSLGVDSSDRIVFRGGVTLDAGEPASIVLYLCQRNSGVSRQTGLTKTSMSCIDQKIEQSIFLAYTEQTPILCITSGSRGKDTEDYARGAKS